MTYLKNTDLQIISAIIKGGKDRELALKALYLNQTIRTRVKHLVIAQHGSDATFTDLFHDAIIIFDKNVRQGKFRMESSISAYIFSIAKFKMLNQVRKVAKTKKEKESKRHPLYATAQVQSPETKYILEEQKMSISEMVQSLGPVTSRVLEMWQLSYSMKEIAEELNLSSVQMARKIKFSMIMCCNNNVICKTHYMVICYDVAIIGYNDT